MKPSRLLIAAAALGLLPACDGNAPSEAGSAPTGEVLDGTISDAMLPVDRVRSEAPLAPPEPTADGERGARTPAPDVTAAVESMPVEGSETPVVVPVIEAEQD